jgi:hypothetical protein
MTDGFEEIGLPALGHNKPPERTPIEWAGELVGRVNRWLKLRPKIVDSEMAGEAQITIDQLRKCRDDLDEELKRERKPHDEAIAELKKRYADPIAMAKDALNIMRQRAQDWLDREARRIADEHARRADAAAQAIENAVAAQAQAERPDATIEQRLEARRAMEQADELADAAADQPERARIKSDLARRAMTKVARWKAKITDETLALDHYRHEHSVIQAALEACTRLATAEAKERKGKDPPPGFQFYDDGNVS